MSCQCVCAEPQDEYFAANIPLCRIFHSHAAKNIPCTVRPSPLMLCSYLTSLHHHHLQAHGKDFCFCSWRRSAVQQSCTFCCGHVWTAAGVKWWLFATKVYFTFKIKNADWLFKSFFLTILDWIMQCECKNVQIQDGFDLLSTIKNKIIIRFK